METALLAWHVAVRIFCIDSAGELAKVCWSTTEMNMAELTLQERALAVLCAMSTQASDQYREMWSSVDEEIKGSAKKSEKVFEVHHRTEMARRCFFESLVLGQTPLECKEHALMVLTNVARKTPNERKRDTGRSM